MRAPRVLYRARLAAVRAPFDRGRVITGLAGLAGQLGRTTTGRHGATSSGLCPLLGGTLGDPGGTIVHADDVSGVAPAETNGA
jgi:hypothetical protein